MRASKALRASHSWVSLPQPLMSELYVAVLGATPRARICSKALRAWQDSVGRPGRPEIAQSQQGRGGLRAAHLTQGRVRVRAALLHLVRVRVRFRIYCSGFTV